MPLERSDLCREAVENFKEARDAWGISNFDMMVEDLRFLDGEQWPEDVEKQRVSDSRPCMVINKMTAFMDQVVGDQLMNRPSIRVRPIDSKADPETAKVINGIIRNIENVSSADIAYDTAFDGAASAGYGVFRIITDYIDRESFDQEIKIKRIKNQFSCIPDPLAQEPDCSDGRYWFIYSDIPRKKFEEDYPQASLTEWEEFDEFKDWIKPDTIRVVEYFYKKYVSGKLYEILYRDTDDAGNDIELIFTVDKLPEEDPPYEILRSRDTITEEIWWLKTNGAEELEGPAKLPGKYYPIIPIWGKELNIQSKTVYRGVIRHAKDPQRLYNYNRSLSAESIALAPKAPYLLTPKQVAGHEKQWQQANVKNYPYLLYNPDAQAQGAPQRQFSGEVKTGIRDEIMISDQEMHDTTGLQLASLGKRSNEISGRAIVARQKMGDTGSFAYINNLGRGMGYAGKVLVDLIPRIYDTPRVVRILGEDDSERFVTVNEPHQDESGKPVLYDLTVGRYDVVVSIGPGYATRREEAVDSMATFIKAVPDAGPIIMDLVAKNSDWPGADIISDRLRKALPPGIAEPEEGEEQQPQEPPPDPMLEIELQKAKIQLQQEQAKLQQELIQVEQEKAKLNKINAELTKIHEERFSPGAKQ